MRGQSNSANSVLVGASLVAMVIVGVFLTYNANRGLPFVSTFRMYADVPDAAELVAGSEVRIGGFRVGQVRAIEAMPAKGDEPPFARLDLALDGDVTGIPEDTIVRVRPRSLLGAKYVELTPGDARGEITEGSVLPVGNALPTPELDEAFNVFDRETREALQATIRNFGDATAGRGADINRAVAAIADTMPSLDRVVRTLADPRTDIAGFIDGAARVTGALAPVAGTLGNLTDNAARTLAAIDGAGDSLEQTIAALPAVEIDGARALRAVTPVLADLTDFTEALGPGTERLPLATARLADALEAGTPVLRRASDLTAPLETALGTLDRIAQDPQSAGAVRKLTTVVRTLDPVVDLLLPAQLVCNVGGLWARNLPSAAGEGDLAGTWVSLISVFSIEQTLQAAEPDPSLHYNGLPNNNAQECESGNEPYAPGQVIGNPAGLQPTQTEMTAPPEGVLDRARAAGLLDPVEGARG